MLKPAECNIKQNQEKVKTSSPSADLRCSRWRNEIEPGADLNHKTVINS